MRAFLAFATIRITHRPLSSSFLGLPYRILNISCKKELLRGLWLMGIEGLKGNTIFRPLCYCSSAQYLPALEHIETGVEALQQASLAACKLKT